MRIHIQIDDVDKIEDLPRILETIKDRISRPSNKQQLVNNGEFDGLIDVHWVSVDVEK